MSALLASVLACVALVLAHLVIWRTRRPRAEYAVLAGLWLAVLLGCLTSFPVLRSAGLGDALPHTVFEYVSFVMLYAACLLPYVTIYSAIQADSPAMRIVLETAAAGRAGLDPRYLDDRLGDEILVLPRLRDLVEGGLVRVEGDRYVITGRGAALARTHRWFRSQLRMERGG